MVIMVSMEKPLLCSLAAEEGEEECLFFIFKLQQMLGGIPHDLFSFKRCS